MKNLSQVQVGCSLPTTIIPSNDACHHSIASSPGSFTNCGVGQHCALGKESDNFQKQDSPSTEEVVKLQKYNSRLALNYIQSVFNKHNFYDIKKTSSSEEKYKVYNHRTAYCLNRQFDSSQSTYLYSGGKITNLFKCGNYKCPVCCHKYFMDKRLEIQKVLDYAKSNNIFVYMVTLTIPHTNKDSYLDVFELASRCKTKLMKHKVIQDKYPIFTISRQEEPYTRNGFHCHYHCLIAFDSTLLEDSKNAIKKQWVKIGKSEGVNISFENGADVKLVNDGEAAVQYMCKETKIDFKSIACEMTASETKVSKKEGMSMYEIIALASQGRWDEMPYNELKVEKLIIEYFSAKKKRIFQGDKNYGRILQMMNDPIMEGVLESDSKDEIEETDTRISITSQAVYQLVHKKLWFKILLIHAKHQSLNNALEEIYIFLNETLGPNNTVVGDINLERDFDNVLRFKFKPKEFRFFKKSNIESRITEGKSDDEWNSLLNFYAPLAA